MYQIRLQNQQNISKMCWLHHISYSKKSLVRSSVHWFVTFFTPSNANAHMWACALDFGSHGLSARRAQWTKSMKPEGPQTSVTQFSEKRLGGRARWEFLLCSDDLPYMFFKVKYNSKASLFSSTFWFERIFGCKTALLVCWPSSWKNDPKEAQNYPNFKIG